MKFKNALKLALIDSVSVLFYSGIPASGVIVLLNIIATDVPVIAKYAPYLASVINLLVFIVKRAFEYYKGERVVK